MAKTAIIYWSGTGNTEQMAKAIYEGIKSLDSSTEIFEVYDISPQKALDYDNLVLGCPSMGSENLEEDSFEPFFSEIESKLEGKNVALFGSYSWGDGEWMTDWQNRVLNANANLFSGEGLIVADEPGSDDLKRCTEFGEQFAKFSN